MFPFKRNVRLHITILSLFVLLTFPVMLTLVLTSYRANSQLIEEYSNKFIEKSVSDNIHNAARLLNPIISTVRSTGALMRDKPEYFREDSSSDYLHEIVESNEAVYAAYAAFEDGSFRQVRRAVPGRPVLGQPIPQDTRFIDRYIDGRKGSAPLDAYRFHAAWGQVLNKNTGPSSYDARQRGYYKEALKAGVLTVSDVYPFASSDDLGITVTIPVLQDGRTVGVFAVDLTLKTLSRYLSDNRVSPNSITIMADQSGGVIAHPELERGLVATPQGMQQNRLDKLGDARVLAALGRRLAEGQDRLRFTSGPDNTEYLAIFSPFPKDFNKPWELLTITPTDDFVGVIKDSNRRLLIFGGGALLLQMLLISWLSRAVAKPMERLADDVSDIRQFKFDNRPALQSRVTEINDLGQAVYLLTRALESFTSYVPRGLVQQLMDSGQGTKLGVESRYLTLFFTDLEGFSTISESEPSQQLLGRVSDYFSTLTGAIEGAHGTVDKFIGDAVMAFWGAPNRIANHGYLACMAAVRAQRRMAVRNRDWQAQGRPPLRVRIGIHSDSVLVGNVGSTERLSYTVMGDGVNLAARLEGLNKEMGTWICVSHTLYRDAGDRLWMRPIDVVSVKGRAGEVLVYELLAIRDADAEVAATAAEIALCEQTTAAYAHYAQKDYAAAGAAYAAILQQFPGDGVATRMLEKAQRALGAAA